MTTAVDDIANARPITIAAAHPEPSNAAPDADHGGRQRELHAAHAHDEPAQRSQPAPRQLEADQEQERHHAELGERRDPLPIVQRDMA